MSKRRNRNRNQTVANNRNNVSDKLEIDYDRLAQSIIKAHLEIDRIKAEIQEEQENKENEEWGKFFNRNTTDKGFLKKILVSVLNIIRFAIKMSKYETDANNSTKSIYGVIRIFNEEIFECIEFVCLILSLVIPIVTMATAISLKIYALGWLALISIVPLLYGLFCRMAKKELYHIKEKEQLIGIFSSMTCFVAMVVSLISMIIAVIGLLMQMNII